MESTMFILLFWDVIYIKIHVISDDIHVKLRS